MVRATGAIAAMMRLFVARLPCLPQSTPASCGVGLVVVAIGIGTRLGKEMARGAQIEMAGVTGIGIRAERDGAVVVGAGAGTVVKIAVGSADGKVRAIETEVETWTIVQVGKTGLKLAEIMVAR